MVLSFLCPGTLEGSTGSGSGFKASQKTGPWLKVSSDRLGEAGNRTCDPWFTRHTFILEILFRRIESWNYREADIRTCTCIYNTQMIIISFWPSNIWFVCVNETSQEAVSFMHIKHLLL